MKRLGTMVDCSRNAVMRPETVEKWIDLTADLGYNCLMLYTEDTYEVENEPYFGYLRGRYSQEELRQLDDYAAAKGMELIPCIQTLAHLNAIFRWPEYTPLRDCTNILLAGDDRSYLLIERMFATISKIFRSKVVNIGLDEAYLLGRGKYLNENGYREQPDILLDHLKRLSQIAKKYDLELIMWDDMFYRAVSNGEYYGDDQEIPATVKAMVPDNVNLIYWDYYGLTDEHYHKQVKSHMQIKDGMWFAGGLWSWSGFASHNAYSLQAMGCAMRQCFHYGVENVFMTLWGDDGGECSKFALLPSLYFVAELAKGNEDMDSIKRGFEEKFSIPFDDFMYLDLLGTPNEKEGEIANPDKYMLYSDCFMGIFDTRVDPEMADSYIRCAEKLRQWKDHKEYGYLFDSMAALCQVLSIKYALGVNTRRAYEAGDWVGLQALTEDYSRLEGYIESFYEVYQKQWMKENKPCGFEIQDVRLGGLLMRIKHCKKRLLAYLSGELTRIEELEEPLLDIKADPVDRSAIQYNNWLSSVTANIV